MSGWKNMDSDAVMKIPGVRYQQRSLLVDVPRVGGMTGVKFTSRLVYFLTGIHYYELRCWKEILCVCISNTMIFAPPENNVEG